MAKDFSPLELVGFLNSLYLALDERIDNYDVYKVETINDCYMVASGVPNRNGDMHVPERATLALDLLHVMKHFSYPSAITRSMNLRMGIHTGSCMAGVLGTVMLKYCLFGETVFIASRMKESGLPNKIHISEKTFLSLKKCGKFKMKCRGPTEIRRRGKMTTYWLLDKNEFDSGNLEHDQLSYDMTIDNAGMFGTRAPRGSAQSDLSESSNPEVKPVSSFPKVPTKEWNEAEVFLQAKNAAI